MSPAIKRCLLLSFLSIAGYIVVGQDPLLQDPSQDLSRKSPFANFKFEVETSPYRQKWFEFRDKKHEEYVKEQLEFENIEFE